MNDRPRAVKNLGEFGEVLSRAGFVLVLLAAQIGASANAQTRSWRDGYSFEAQPATSICNAALAPGHSWDSSPSWDERRGFIDDVAEAKRRGYTPQYCAAVLAKKPLPPLAVATPEVPAAPVIRTPDPLIVSIQTLLGVLGYDAGNADGFSGPRTMAAVAAFEQKMGGRSDGQLSKGLQARLQAALAERGPGAAVTPSLPSPRQAKPASSGTGFFVGADALVTNHHVVDGCVEIRIRKHNAEIGVARLIAANRADDLAALQTDKRSENHLRLRVGVPLKAAESLLVFGYPLSNALSAEGNTTLGNVTALAGINDDSRYLQISAAVQPGNSGGPVLDEAGRLIGVVVGKLDALRIVRATGDIPQNVNFAIRAATLGHFLETSRIPYEVATASTSLPNTLVAEQAEAASVQIECRK